MVAEYLLDLVTVKDQFIISHCVELTEVIDPTIVIVHQRDETKKISGNFILGLQSTSLRSRARAFQTSRVVLNIKN